MIYLRIPGKKDELTCRNKLNLIFYKNLVESKVEQTHIGAVPSKKLLAAHITVKKQKNDLHFIIHDAYELKMRQQVVCNEWNRKKRM